MTKRPLGGTKKKAIVSISPTMQCATLQEDTTECQSVVSGVIELGRNLRQRHRLAFMQNCSHGRCFPSALKGKHQL